MKYLFLFTIIIAGLNISCSTSTYYKEAQYNPQTGHVEDITYSPYYQLKTDSISDKLELTLIAHLKKETVPGSYTLKKWTHRLLPNDYMAKSDVLVYLYNSGEHSIEVELIAVNIEQQHLPYSNRTISIPAYESISWNMGQIDLDLRLTSLNTRIEYIAETHNEKEFFMQRIISETKEENKSMQSNPQL